MLNLEIAYESGSAHKYIQETSVMVTFSSSSSPDKLPRRHATVDRHPGREDLEHVKYKYLHE